MRDRRLLPRCGWTLVALAVGLCLGQHLVAVEPAAASTLSEAPAPLTVSIDWLAEMGKGGVTVLVQLLLVVVGTACVCERFIRLRRNAVVPDALVEDVKPLWLAGDYAGIARRCASDRSTLARIVDFLVRHRNADYQTLMQGASDIGSRDLKRHHQKAYPLAVVATLEPLLGLLGTMIGMIEAFAKVAAFGDMGNASMLADAIGKALITTALGLVIAIPALALYHWFKQRTSLLGTELEEAVDELATSWFIAAAPEKPSAGSAGSAGSAKPSPLASAAESTPVQRPTLPEMA